MPQLAIFAPLGLRWKVSCRPVPLTNDVHVQAAEAYSSKINLRTLNKEARADLAKPLKILSILDVNCEDKGAVGQFIQAAMAKFVVGNLSQMCRFELWLCMKVIESSPVAAPHKELLVEVLTNINSII